MNGTKLESLQVTEAERQATIELFLEEVRKAPSGSNQQDLRIRLADLLAVNLKTSAAAQEVIAPKESK